MSTAKPEGIDLKAVRADFPILDRMINGRPLAYLDNAASSQNPTAVIEAIASYYRTTHSNVHRGIHAMSQQATDMYEQARASVATLLGCSSDPAQVIWTRGTTEGLNLVASAWARPRLGPGDEVLITEIEHHSNIVPWQLVCNATGAGLRWVKLADHRSGPLAADFCELINSRTKVVALTQMSNVLGNMLNVGEIARMAHAVGAVIVVDGAQSTPNMPIDVEALDLDFFACSGHKMLGPTGIGALYGKRELLEAADPYQGGGDMIATVAMEGSTWNQLPFKFEAGTPNIAGAIGMGVAAEYLQNIGLAEINAHEKMLAAYALEQLGAISGITIYGPADPDLRGGVVSFNLGDLHPHDLGQVLDSDGIAVRAGHHCAQPLMAALGVGSTARASFYLYNTKSEVDRLAAGVERAREFFGL